MNRTGIALLLALLLQGCTELTQAPPPPASPQPYQRFVPVAASDRDFALDTKTGQLCKTWNWSIANSPLSSLPQCIELYNQTEFLNRPPIK